MNPNARDRFLKAMNYEVCDRPPLWEEGIVDETWEAWRPQGLESPESFRQRYPFDRHETVDPDLFPKPEFQHRDQNGFAELRGRYVPDIAERLPEGWPSQAEPWACREHPLGVTVSRGLLLSCGIRNWNGLTTVLEALYDSPREIDATMECVVDMALSLLGEVRDKTTVDFAVFNEPIASFHGPVVSPEHYRRFCFGPYTRLLDILRARGVGLVVVRTWGNALPLISLWVELGFSALWNDHCNAGGVAYTALRRRFGKELCLIGGIDSRALYADRAAIDRTVENTVPALLESGGYLPMLDDRVRKEVPYENYRYYRERLTELVTGG